MSRAVQELYPKILMKIHMGNINYMILFYQDSVSKTGCQLKI